MTAVQIELNPVSHITTDAIGKPGQRVFYLQGSQGSQVVTLIIEKVQLQTLAIGVEQFLAELTTANPDLPPANGDFDPLTMRITPPVDPLFRVGELGLGYDAETDLMMLHTREVVTEGQDSEDLASVRFWATRSQILALCTWGLEVAGRGRPICPQCGEPMEPEGHFCPKKNGHKH